MHEYIDLYITQIEYGDQRLPGDVTPLHHRSPSHRSTGSVEGGRGGGQQGGAPPVPIAAVVDRFYPRRYRDISLHEMR